MRLMDEIDEVDEVVCIRVYCTTTVHTYIYLQAVFQGPNDVLVAGSSPVATPYSPYQPLPTLTNQSQSPYQRRPILLYWYWYWYWYWW